ncbi:23906_t:CDS:2, partial [Gigaspora margarita]
TLTNLHNSSLQNDNNNSQYQQNTKQSSFNIIENFTNNNLQSNSESDSDNWYNSSWDNIQDENNTNLEKSQFGAFENFTTMAMFIWVTVYMTSAYQDLIQIILHPQFEKSCLITNLQKLKKYRERLPLMQIKSHTIPINTRNTPSTTKNSTTVYYFSLIEHLQRILKNPVIRPQLYFGPGVLSDS